MTTHSPALIPGSRGGRARWLAGMLAFAAAMFAANAPAQAPAAPGGAAAAPSAEELEKLVGRIALYPDDLVAIILPAATNPLQLVQADRYLEKRKANPKLPLDDKWDDPVKTLLNYPEVVKMMSADLDWTSDLGEAVVADQGEVLEAIQAFRRKTQSAGNLKTDAKQTVVVEKEVIKIVPADPQVIYVPQYNPSSMYVTGGYSAWGYYPAPYPSYYYPYPPGAALATGLIWGAAIGAAWNGGRYGANYGGGGNNTINVNRNTTVNQSANVNRSGTGGGQAAGGSGQWKSDKKPGQVSSSTGRTQSARAGDAGSRGGAGGAAGAGRPSTQPAGGGAGGGRDAGGGSGASGGAFGGSSASGRQTQMDSSRGASSRGSSSASSMGGGGGGSRSGASAGGGGGGGGRGGGGGGGGRR